MGAIYATMSIVTYAAGFAILLDWCWILMWQHLERFAPYVILSSVWSIGCLGICIMYQMTFKDRVADMINTGIFCAVVSAAMVSLIIAARYSIKEYLAADERSNYKAFIYVLIYSIISVASALPLVL